MSHFISDCSRHGSRGSVATRLRRAFSKTIRSFDYKYFMMNLITIIPVRYNRVCYVLSKPFAHRTVLEMLEQQIPTNLSFQTFSFFPDRC